MHCSFFSNIPVISDGSGKLLVEEEKVFELAGFIQSEGLLLTLIEHIQIIPFEARKDTALIFNNMIRRYPNFLIYIMENLSIIERIIQGYNNPDTALSCGSMLREAIRHESIVKYVLNSDSFYLFFDSFVHLPNFDVASDAFNTLRDLLTTPKDKKISSEFLEINCDTIFKKYEVIITLILLLLLCNY